MIKSAGFTTGQGLRECIVYSWVCHAGVHKTRLPPNDTILIDFLDNPLQDRDRYDRRGGVEMGNIVREGRLSIYLPKINGYIYICNHLHIYNLHLHLLSPKKAIMKYALK